MKFSISQKRRRISRNAFFGMGAILIVLSGVFAWYQLKDGSGAGAMVVKASKVNLLEQQWDYMPGVTRESGGLRSTPLKQSLASQDGKQTLPVAPVNLFGTHLEEVHDVALSAEIRELSGTASMQLYGQAPIIADEFRVERKSVRLTISAVSLDVDIWDGTKQQPVASQSFPLRSANPGDTIRLKVEYQDGQLVFRYGDKVVGRTAARGVFDQKAIWFGFDGTDDWLLSAFEASAIQNTTFEVVDSSRLQVTTRDAAGLQALAAKKRPGFTVGAAVALGPAVSDPDYARTAFGGNLGAITTENALKWQFVHPQPTVYDFHEADALVELAQRHDMKVQGHTLVFGEANPEWVRKLPTATAQDKQQVEKVMTDHINAVVSHYKGKIALWDVVNEPMDGEDETWSQLRDHVWHKAMGESYIPKAFQAARAADPNALLFLNDFGLEEDGERWDALLTLVTTLKKAGVPIDGVGFETHVYDPADKIDVAVLRKHIQQLAAVGLKARISEMDVYSEDGAEVQAALYADVLKACLDEPNCISWTTWGVSDRYNWFKDDDGSVQQGQDFLWGTNMEATPAINKLQQLLR